MIATLALGQTLVILTAGIDLSAGAIAVFSSILMANMATKLGIPGFLAMHHRPGPRHGDGRLQRLAGHPDQPAAVHRHPGHVVDLLLAELGGVAQRDDPRLGHAGDHDRDRATTRFRIAGFSLTWGTIIMLLLFAFFWYALGNTAWGKHVYATGDDVEAARLSGIRTSRVLLSVYLVAGLIYAVGAWILMGRLASASPNVGTEYNLNSITAVVLGGTSLFGGRGLVLGTLVGALIVGVFQNGLQLAGVDVVWQGTAIGLLVLVAVGLDQWIRKVKA